MKSALDLFDNITEDDEVSENLIIEQANRNDETYNSEEYTDGDKKKKEKKTKNTKFKIRFLKKPEDYLRLSILDNVIVDNAEVKEFAIDEDEVSLNESWVEFLLFLLGAINNSNRETFINRVTSTNIFNENIKIRKKQVVHLDKEQMNVYMLPDTDYYIEIYNTSSIVESIKGCFKVMGVIPKEVTLHLVSKVNAEIESNKVRLINTKKSLAELINGVPDSFNVHSVSIDDGETSINGLKYGIVLLLSYIISTNENVDALLNKYTVKDIVGVTPEFQDYIGLMDRMKLPNTDLYFYSNGMQLPLLEYLANICLDLNININNISFGYKTLAMD